MIKTWLSPSDQYSDSPMKVLKNFQVEVVLDIQSQKYYPVPEKKDLIPVHQGLVILRALTKSDDSKTDHPLMFARYEDGHFVPLKCEEDLYYQTLMKGPLPSEAQRQEVLMGGWGEELCTREKERVYESFLEKDPIPDQKVKVLYRVDDRCVLLRQYGDSTNSLMFGFYHEGSYVLMPNQGFSHF